MAEAPTQGAGIVYLGTPATPTLYTARVVRGPSDWQRLALAFVATDPTLRITLGGQASSAGKTVEYDGVRFLPPGRNPVLVMAAIFARFLPHLTLDATSVQMAADRRNEWLFSGYIPDPGRTDQLLTRMSQECFCTLFKDLDGVYKITADDPDQLPVLHLDSQHDIFQETLEVQSMPMDQVYTDFYLWYQRVNTQVTTSQAGQYAAVLYVTPDQSISQYPELQTLCSQAAQTLQTRTRFDFYSDFIADPATADLLLSRFVRQLSVLRQEVALQAALPALPLSLTDHVAVRAPLLGPQPFVGEARRYALAFSAQSPGLAAGLTLRQAGLLRGVWESWDAAGLEAFPGGMGPPGAARVRERWEESVPPPTEGEWFFHSRFAPPVTCCYGLVGVGSGQLDMAAGDDDSTVTTSTGAPAWLFRNSNVASASWDTGLTLTGGGRGTALGLYDGTAYVTVQPATSPYNSQLWRLESSSSGSGTGTLLPAFNIGQDVVTCMQEWAGMGDGNWLYLGADFLDPPMWRWNGTTLQTIAVTGSTHYGQFRGFCLLGDGITHSPILLAVSQSYGVSVGAGIYRLTGTPGSLTWQRVHTFSPFQGYVSNIISLGETALVVTGDQFGTQMRAVGLTRDDTTAGFTATTLHAFTVPEGEQIPGALGRYDNQWYFGRINGVSTPLLELWRSADGVSWDTAIDFATIPATDATLDLNTGITAMATARGRFYVATSSMLSGPQPGVRVYCYPTAEAATPSPPHPEG